MTPLLPAPRAYDAVMDYAGLMVCWWDRGRRHGFRATWTLLHYCRPWLGSELQAHRAALRPDAWQRFRVIDLRG